MKMRPITEARWSATRGGRGQPVDARGDQRLQRVGDPLACRRAGARRACAPSPRRRAGCPRSSRARPRCRSAGRAAAVSASTSSALSSGCSGSSSSVVARTRPPPQVGRTSRSSRRARQTIRRSGASRTEAARCSISSSSGSSPQCTSSKTSTSGCACGELLRPRARGPGDLLLRALALDGLEHADGEPEQVGDRLVLAAVAQLLLRVVERVVVGDAGRRLHHLRERPVRDAFAVRQAAADEHGRALEPGDELAREPALPDAGVAVDREERARGVSRTVRS